MDSITLIRHGQAGKRDDYDRLSDLGREQALALKQHFEREGIQFQTVLSGGLRRQRETAEILFGGADVDERWNEFDLDRVYAEIAPQLAEHDAEFRASHQQLQEDMKDLNHGVHREWRSTDIEVVKAWMAGKFPTEMESWVEFVERIQEAGRELARFSGQGPIAVVTSATPISITTAAIFHADARKTMELASALVNTATNEYLLRDGHWMLRGFNNFSHLPIRAMRTFR